MSDRQPDPIASEVVVVFAKERASATRAPQRTASTAVSAERESGEPRRAPVAHLSLTQAQQWFQAVITEPNGVLAGAKRAATLTGSEASLDAHILPGANITASEALEIYSYGYRARLIECLADDYPALVYTLGEADFEELAVAYIETFPSSSPNLNAFGKHMATLCESRSDPRARFMADLARLEWALVEVLHAADAKPLAVEALATLPPERIHHALLTPSETLRVHRFAYDVNGFYQAFKNETEPTIPAAHDTAIAIYREKMTLWRMNLTPAMATLLEDLARGVALGVALERMSKIMEGSDELAEAERNVSAWFQSWVRCGFFRDIVVPEEAA